MERLQKILAEAGVASRRKAEQLILDNRVKVNGIIVNTLGFKASKSDEILVDDKPINKEEKVYYIFNKPKNVISSVTDHRKRKTVVEFIDTDKRVFPVGRLDYDTTGLLIITNDGELTNSLLHPRYNIEKEYVVTIKGILSKDDIKELENGIIIDNRKTLPANVTVLSTDKKANIMELSIIIREGRHHEIKNMMKYFNTRVCKLNRIRFGPIELKGLKLGEYRPLKSYEIKQLKTLGKE